MGKGLAHPVSNPRVGLARPPGGLVRPDGVAWLETTPNNIAADHPLSSNHSPSATFGDDFESRSERSGDDEDNRGKENGDREFSSSTSSSCEFAFSKSYAPSREIDWTTVDMTPKTAWSFNEPQVDEEYLKYVFRNLSSCVPIATWVIACATWPPLNLVPFSNFWKITFWVFVGLLLILLALDLYLHFFQPLTIQTAMQRRLIAIVGVSICALSVGPTLWESLPKCEDSTDHVDAIWPGRYDRIDVHKYCINVIWYYTAAIPCIVLNITRLAPPAVAGVSLLHFLSVLSPRIYANHEETAEELAVKVIIYTMLYILGIAQSYVRHKVMRKQFEVSVEIVRASKLAEEKDATVDTLLCAMLHEEVLDRLVKNPDQVLFDHAASGSVFFSDMVNFTKWSSSHSPQEVVALLNVLCIDLDRTTHRFKMEKVKTIGDAYWATCGLPIPVLDHAENCFDFATAFFSFVEEQNIIHPEWEGINFRVGLHCGPLFGAVLGTQQLSYEAFGSTCEIAMQVEARGVAGCICVTEEFLNKLEVSEKLSLDHAVVKIGEFSPKHSMNNHGSDGTTDDEKTTIAIYRIEFSEAHEGFHDEVASSIAASSKGGARGAGTHHSASVVSHMIRMQEVAKVNRKRFLEKRSQRRKTQLKTSSETLDSIREKYTERKYSWVFMDFKDKRTEQLFREFLHRAHQPMRILTKLFLFCLCGVLWIALAIEGRSWTPPVASTILLSVSLALSVLNLGMAIKNYSPVIEGLSSHLLGLLTIIGCGLIPNSTIGNSLVWLQVTFTCTISIGTVAFDAVVLVLLNIALFLIPAMYFEWNSVYFPAALEFCFVACGVGLCQIVLTEKATRHQFLEERISRHFRLLEIRKSDQQAMLLESMVPKHVIPDLMRWLKTDLDPRETILRYYDSTVVSFVRLHPPSDGKIPIDAGRHAQKWMLSAHQEVDTILKNLVSSTATVLKIKTIGDVVMLAGPFEHTGDAQPEEERDRVRRMQEEEDEMAPPLTLPPSSLDEAADAMLAVVVTLCQALGLQCEAGIHIGQVMGAVLGTNRLTFDIFGDCVNVASRCMTSLGAAHSEGAASPLPTKQFHGSQIAVSKEFYEAFSRQHLADVATETGNSALLSSTEASAAVPPPVALLASSAGHHQHQDSASRPLFLQENGLKSSRLVANNGLGTCAPELQTLTTALAATTPTDTSRSSKAVNPLIVEEATSDDDDGSSNPSADTAAAAQQNHDTTDPSPLARIETPTESRSNPLRSSPTATTMSPQEKQGQGQQAQLFSSGTAGSFVGSETNIRFRRIPVCGNDFKFGEPQLIQAKGKSDVRTLQLQTAPSVLLKFLPTLPLLLESQQHLYEEMELIDAEGL